VNQAAFRARLAISTIFFVNGVVLASWVPHIPAVKQQHAISDGALGIVLLSMAAGAVLALPLAGWLVTRFGSRNMTAVAAIALCLALPLPVLSPNLALLSCALLIFGASNAVLDVSMNAQAVVVEQQYRRAIMSSFHALFSLGGLFGAALAGTAMARGMGDTRHVTIMMLAGVCMTGLAIPSLWPSNARRTNAGPVFVKPTGSLLGLGLLAFLGLLAEGSMGDWSAVYLHDALGSSAALAAAGFASFSLLMAVGRLSGDWLVNRFGPGPLLRACAAIAAGGLGTALLVGTPLAGIVGFGLVGFGIANVIPILFSSAGRVPGVEAGNALAAVATTGYFGFLAGPPLIGLAAEATSLPAALGLVSACCGLIAAFGGIVGRIGGRSRMSSAAVA
jgi:MFS family permease